jgi:viroplasmin and RNaseH domain-containing protein
MGESVNRQCRAITSVVTTGYKDNDFKGFNSLQRAKEYMEERGVLQYQIHDNSGERGSESNTTDYSFYAVANGREKGIYRNYR